MSRVFYHSFRLSLFHISGADLSALVREASMAALRERIDVASIGVQESSPSKLSVVGIGQRHFDIAFSRIKPSVSKKVGILAF